MPHLVGNASRFDQRLAGHAAVIQAVAAHFVRFYQRYFGFDCRSNVAGDQASGTAANDDQVAVILFGALPFGIDASALQKAQKLFSQHGKDAEQCKRQQQAGRQNA